MTQVIIHANETCTVKSDQPSSIDLAMLRAGHWSGLVRNAYFVLEDVPAEVVPAGAYIDSATFYFQSDDGGGYSATLAGLVIFCDNTGRDFYDTSWNNPLPAYGSSTAVSIYGVNNNLRSASLTAHVQALIDNAKTGVRTLKLYRNPNTDTGTYDGKYFSLTHSDHYLVINYTEPPDAPTIGTAERVSDTQATIGWTNAVTGGPYASQNVLRSTDGAADVQIATGLAAAATGYVDPTISANHVYTYKAVGVNSAGSATSAASNAIYTTPAAPTIGVAVKTGASAVTVNWTDNANSEEYFAVRRRVDGGAWSTLSATIAAGSTSYNDAAAPGGTVEYAVQALRGALVSDWSANSNAITTTVAPAAPTLTAWPAYSPTGTVLRVSWQHNTLDGSAQTKAYITYTKDGAQTTYEYTGALGCYDIPITGLAATKVVTANVKTKGLHADYGPDSAALSTIVADTPSVAITTPAIDGTVVSDLPLVAAWSVTDEYSQARWTLRLWHGTTLVKIWAGTTETSQSISSEYLEDDSAFTLDLEVVTGSGFASALVERSFTTDYEAPTVPTVEATFDPVTLSTMIAGEVGATGALPATDHLALTRIDTYDGVAETVVLSDPYTAGSVITDYVPRLDQNVTYRLQAVAANGAYSYADAVVATKSQGSCAVNYGAGDADLLRMQWNHEWEHAPTFDNEKYVFAGRRKPVPYKGEHVIEAIKVSAVLLDEAQQVAFRALIAWADTGVFRKPHGFRENVSIDAAPYSGPKIAGSVTANLDMTVVE